MEQPTSAEIREFLELKVKLFPPGVMFTVVEFDSPDDRRYNELARKVVPWLNKAIKTRSKQERK